MNTVTIEEAKTLLLNALPPVPACEWVQPQEAAGRITAQDITAAQPYPPYRKSPFDGYALHSNGGQGYQVLATLGAGFTYDAWVAPGQAVRLMTGCAVPDGCDTVVPQEYVQQHEAQIHVQTKITPGSNIVPIGEECKQGAVVIPAGTYLTPGRLSVAVGLGNEKICVCQKPHVLFLTSGQELVMPGTIRQHGQIYNSNAFLFQPLLTAYGADVTFYHLSDAPEKLAAEIQAVQNLAQGKELIISTGGVSVGLFDTLPQIYEHLGAHMLYNRIRMRPGSASYGGCIGEKTLVLGLSGNPSAAFNAFHLLALPVLRRLSGEKDADFPTLTCTLTDDIHKENPVDRFVQGRVHFCQGKSLFTPNTTLTSSALLGLAHTNALGVIKKGAAPYTRGDSIEVLFLNR